MFDQLPRSYEAVKDWTWHDYQPYVDHLLARDLNDATAHAWLLDYTHLSELLEETYTRLAVANTRDTTDEEIEARLHNFLENMMPPILAASNALDRKIVDSGVQPENFAIALRNMRAEIEIFREANLPLLPEDEKIGTEYDKISGAQTIEWEGEEITLVQAGKILLENDRDRREKSWRLASERSLQDREAINDIWKRLLALRVRIAANADLPDYRAYQWKAKKRFDYTPEDCITFHNAIEQVAVPAAQAIYEKRRQQLGVETLRPWDTKVDPLGRDPLRPFETIDELTAKMSAIYHRVDPELGAYFDIMRRDDLLDLDNRKGKAPGGYNTSYPLEKKPFIFMNAVGTHDNVQTLLHEGGHAFHVFETNHWGYIQQRDYPIEFAEVASMAMEMLGAPYLVADAGGYYTESEAARARIEHLEDTIAFLPYMAVVDAFQHWAYTHPDDAADPANCDAAWGDLWDRFMKGIDYSGLEDSKVTGWHRKLHIYRVPFYYVEYGLAQLGAVQVYGKARQDQAGAVRDYRRALSLGYTVPLPDLFAAAGAKFGFDVPTVQGVVDLAMNTIAELENGAG